MYKKKTIKIGLISLISIICLSGLIILFMTLTNNNNNNNNQLEHIHEWKMIVVNPTCVLEGSIVEKCDCGKINNKKITSPLGHSYTNGICNVCGNEEGHIHIVVIDGGITPTCTTVGLTEGSHCSECGIVLREQMKISKNGHSLGEWYTYIESTKTENGEKRRNCSNCEYYEIAKLPLKNHKYDLVEIVSHTCCEYGYEVYKCRDCDDVYYDNFTEKLSHYDITKEIKSTCITDGYIQKECTMCNRILVVEHKLAKGHTYGEWVVQKEPTCTTEGLEIHQCIYCDEVETRKIEKLSHNYVLNVEQNLSSKLTYQCINCKDLITIDEDKNINQVINPQIYVDDNFKFNIIYAGNDVEYIKENLIIIDTCLIGSEYENNPSVYEEYQITQKSDGVWMIDPVITPNDNGTYVVILKNSLLFEDYVGDTLTYTYLGNEKNLVEFNENIKFLQRLETMHGGYYPYFISTNENTEYIYVTVQRDENIEKGDLLYVGKAESIDEIRNGNDEGFIGKIYDIYENENEEYIVVLESPELEEIFTKLDIYDKDKINFEDYPELEDEISDQVLSSFYQSEEFLEFLIAADAASIEYFGERDLESTPLNQEVFLEDVKIDKPKFDFKDGKATILLEGKYTNPIKTEEGKEIGSFDISFTAKVELEFDISASIKIKYKWGVIPKGVKYFDINLTQKEKFTFDFHLDFNIDYEVAEGEQPKFVYVSTTHKIHTADCIYLNITDKENIIYIKDSELKEYSEKPKVKTCEKCKPIEKLDASVLVINKLNKTVHCYNCYHIDDININNREYYYGSINKIKNPRFCSYCKPQNKEESGYREKLLENLKHAKWSEKLEQIKNWADSTTNEEVEEAYFPLLKNKRLPSIAGIITPRINIGVIFDFEFKANLDCSYEQGSTNIYGIRYESGKVRPYSQHKDSNKETSLTIAGEMNFKTGIRVGLDVSIAYLNKWVNVGLQAESGFILDLDGIAHISQKNYEYTDYVGVYSDGYIYVDIDGTYKFFSTKGELSILSTEFHILRFGYDKTIYNYVNDLDNILMRDDIYYIDMDKILEVYYYDIQNHETKTELLDINSDFYTITFELEDGRYCEYKNGVIRIKEEAPSEFTDKLIIKVRGNTDWKEYQKGSVSVFLDDLEININYVNKEVHVHTESSWEVVIEATCQKEGRKEISCTICKEILQTETIDKIDHNYENGKCAMCSEEDPSIPHVHIETDWYVIGEPTCISEGKKAIGCISCKEILKTEKIEKIPHNYENGRCTMCNIEKPNEEEHEHIETSWYIVEQATCSKEGIREISCTKCHEVLQTEKIEKISHNYVDGKCIVCNSYDSDYEANYSQGLEYELNSDNNSYSVIGMGTCTNTEIIIPSTYKGLPVTNIGNSAFAWCDTLTSVKIPNSITTIGYDAFVYCTSLKNINIPSGVTTIGSHAFHACVNLTYIEIPSNVVNIDLGAFSYCERLVEIKLDNNNQNYKLIDGNLYNKKGDILIQYLISKTDTIFSIPSTVTTIGYLAFAGCSNLEIVEIPDNVITIEANAFSSCENLTNVTIPKNVISIGENVFTVCPSLTISCEVEEKPSGWNENWNLDNCPVIWNYKNIVEYSKGLIFTLNSDNMSYAVTDVGSCEDKNVIIPNIYEGFPVTSIGKKAFYNCDTMKTITIPSSIKTIKSDAFTFCSYISMVFYNGTMGDWCSITFDDTPMSDNCHFYMLDENKEYYEVTEIVIPNTVTIIRDNTFLYFNYIVKVTIPDTVTTIGKCAFFDCNRLQDIEIPRSVVKIDEQAFGYCSKLTSIVIPSTVTNMSEWAFYYCKNTTIYCEAPSRPRGWVSSWYKNINEVVWGYAVE